MEYKSSLDNVVNTENKHGNLYGRMKQGICYLTLSAFLAGYGCGPRQEMPAQQEPIQPKIYELKMGDIPDNKFGELDMTTKLKLMEGKPIYADATKAKELTGRDYEQEEKEGKKKAVATSPGWFAEHKKSLLIGAGILAAAGAGFGVYKIGDNNGWFGDKHKNDHNPSKGGRNPNVGPDNGNGDDHDKDGGNW